MKQIVDKLNKIAKKIDESVEIPQTDLIIDSLDAITKAYGGTPNDSNLIVDKLDDIAGVAHSGITPSGNIEITENTAEGEPLDISQYATATVNVAGGGTLATVEFEENGTYSPSDYEAYGFGEVTVNVPSGNNVKTLELTVNATGTTQTGPIKGPNIDENGLYNEGFGVNTASPVTVQALIKYSRLNQKYSVFLESPNIVFFTNNNTGINCVITFDSEYPKELYIDITDITQPASAVINVTTGGVG